MLNTQSNRKVYLAKGYTDMRKSIDGLATTVQLVFNLNPFDDAYFVFCGKTKDRIKILHWDGSGFCLFMKRFEFGKIKWPNNKDIININESELSYLLSDLKLIRSKQNGVDNSKYIL